MTGYTKGPWVRVEGDRFEKEAVITTEQRIAESKGAICEMDYIFTAPHGDEQEANINLIAAAPELLEALEYAMPYLEACVPEPRNGANGDVNCVARASAAIAKARGTQS